MKILKLRIERILYLLMGILLLNGCATKISFTKSIVVPAAKGKVKVKKDKNNNYSINIDVDHLAKSTGLTPPANTYVVWIRTGDGKTKNIGQLKVSSALISGKLKASLSTVSTFKPTLVYITAERNADITFPQGQTVLTTESF